MRNGDVMSTTAISDGKYVCEHAVIDGSRFTDVSMQAVKFDDVNMANASFTNINLSGSVFDDINMSGVEIKNANFTGMTIDGILVTELLAAHAKSAA